MTKENSVWSNVELAGEIAYDQQISLIEDRNAWHGLFNTTQWVLLNPADEVIDFYRDYLKSPSASTRWLLKGDYRRIHDLGVGGGRHLCFFAEHGYDVIGSDISTNAISLTDEEIRRRSLNARTVRCPMTQLPFADAEFDVTLTRATINHATLVDMKQIVSEIARTTRPSGLLFATVSSDRASDYRSGAEVVTDESYVLQEGPEAGLIHTFFTAERAAALFEPYFVVTEVYLAEHAAHMPDAPGATPKDSYFGSEYVVIGVRR